MVWKSVERLDEVRRDAVHLHFYQGLSIRETAQVQNVAASTVKYRLREAIKTLRGNLQGEDTLTGNPAKNHTKETLKWSER